MPKDGHGDVIVVESNGGIRVASRGAARRLSERAGEYVLTADSPSLLVLRRVMEEGQHLSGPRIVMSR